MPASGPPAQSADLVELITLEPTLHLDIRYATAQNFVHRQVYAQARAFLLRDAAVALVRVHRGLRARGYGLLIFDGYRPWRVTRTLWELTPPADRAFVANPRRGSRHNRGCAVDLSLYELATGAEVPMPSGYDEASPRSAAKYAGGTESQRRALDVLIAAMASEGFAVLSNEWWHYDLRGCDQHPLVDVPFEALRPATPASAAPTPAAPTPAAPTPATPAPAGAPAR